jgi:hypothetical protein
MFASIIFVTLVLASMFFMRAFHREICGTEGAIKERLVRLGRPAVSDSIHCPGAVASP